LAGAIVAAFPAAGRCDGTSDKIEKAVRAKDWQAVDAIIGGLPTWKAQSENYNMYLTQASRAAVGTVRGFDACEQAETWATTDESSRCYAAVLSAWQNMPRPAPFSARFMEDLDAARSAAREKLGGIDGERRRDAAAVERYHKQAEAEGK
jgi:hypothetical protein